MTETLRDNKSPVREATYRGDQTGMVNQVVGPDRRGIFWHATHCNYDAEADRSKVVFRPVPKDVIERMAGGPEQLQMLRDALMSREFASTDRPLL